MAFKRKIKSKLLIIMAIIIVLSMWQKFKISEFSNYKVSNFVQEFKSYEVSNIVYKSKSHGASDTEQSNKQSISCYSPYIIDGDTFSCDGERIRLANIDAPEMPEHCRKGRRCTFGNPFASKSYLHSISRGSVRCLFIKKDHYGRTIALCKSGGKDLSCAMVAAGHAVERYGGLRCQ